MREIAEYLMENYYSKYTGGHPEIIPTLENLCSALMVHADKLVVIRKDDEIRAIAVFVTLTDATYEIIESIDQSNLDNLKRLLKENGENIHFILLTARSLSDILMGVKEVKKRKPKTMSWWNPSMTKLHKYNMN